MAVATPLKRRLQPWQMLLSASVFAYLALGLATSTVRPYHWFMLIIIPAAFLAAERCRSFFLDWAPLVAFWLVYDRLRLLQPVLLHRVAVAWPYELELWLFGGLFGGDVPAHASRAWLAGQPSATLGAILSWTAQIIYLSHIFVVPGLFMWMWVRGRRDQQWRRRFQRMMRAFAYLNFAAILIYVLVPVAPPWWVSLYGTAQPTPELIAHLKMSSAMDGKLVSGLIQNAAQWFAAVPSLHGAYPVLLVLLIRRHCHKAILVAVIVYAMAMWAATVALNQHYVVDLIAGGLIAWGAWGLSEWRGRLAAISATAKADTAC